MNNPYNQLTKAASTKDDRPIQVRQKLPILVPRYNQIYDSVRSQQAWRYAADAQANSTFTTVANTQVNTQVKFASQPIWRFSQWPGAVHGYLVIRSFSLAPQTVPATVGNLDCYFIDAAGGNTIPLGDFMSNTGNNISTDILIPTPITDTENTVAGVLAVTLNGTTPSTAVYNYQLGFSVAYLTPALSGYEVQHQQTDMEVR